MATTDSRAGLNRINSVTVPVSVVVCAKALKLSELLKWEPGATLTFDQSPSSEFSLCIGRRTIGLGRAVTVGNRAALQLVQVNPNPATDHQISVHDRARS